MLTAQEINEETLDAAKRLERILPRYGFPEKPMFYLQECIDNEEDLAAILDAGYPSIARRCEDNVVAVMNEEIPVLPYILGEDIVELSEIMTRLCDYRSYLLYVTDLNLLYETDILESEMSDMLSYIHKLVSTKLMNYVTIEEAAEDIPDAVNRLNSQKNSYEAFSVAQSWKIAELEKKIQEVYSKW